MLGSVSTPDARPRRSGTAARALITRCGLALGLLAAAFATPALGQQVNPPTPPPERVETGPLEGRPIREVRIEGVRDETLALVQNQIRVRAGTPLNAQAVQGDLRTLNRLGRFAPPIEAKLTELEDGSVVLTYALTESPIILDIQPSGNVKVSDQEIAGVVNNLLNTPVDQYRLDQAARAIERLYREKGFYRVDVTVNEEELEKNGIVIFEIRERLRLRVMDIRFEGVKSVRERQLRSEIETEEWNLLNKGRLDDTVLAQDVNAIVDFYKDRGYLDVRADRRLIESPDGSEVIVIFLVNEGPRYTLRSVLVHRAPTLDERDEGVLRPPPRVFSPEQLRALIPLAPGDVASQNRIRESLKAIRESYGRLGYADVAVDQVLLRDPDRPVVDLRFVIAEGERSRVGLVEITGNTLTKNKVPRRLIELRPGRPLDSTRFDDDDTSRTRSTRDLARSRLFDPASVRVTVQPANPTLPGERDVLVEVEETNTGAVSFGAAVGSDSGLVGFVQLTQRNFDITDTPDSLSEFIAGRAFRGGGQTFEISLAPGTEVQTYEVRFIEPHLFESDISGSINGGFRTRSFSQYDENRLFSRVRVGRRFGQRWSGGIAFRAQRVQLQDIDADAPVDVFEVQDANIITGVQINATRTTIDRAVRPTSGSRVELTAEQVGLFGDFTFTSLRARGEVILPVYESFLGRTTTLTLETDLGYIPQGEDEAPVYERFYLGGTSLRGFRFRTVAPKGIRNDNGLLGDDPVGGTWSFRTSTQLEQPLFGDFVAGVAFVDAGTVTNDPGFDDMRLSAGVGLRLYIDQLSSVPLAFDFGFPIVKQFGDEERVFSFKFDLPLN